MRALWPRIGVDENGLGAQLGPLIVTAVLADVDERGTRFLSRKLPKALRRDLDDSKALVSCHDFSLGEAWARAIVRSTHSAAATPPDLLRHLLREPEAQLRKRCPGESESQCWPSAAEAFVATDEQVARQAAQLATLASRGVVIRAVRSEVICTSKLNELKQSGVHRFAADLHAMERLVLALRELCSGPVLAVCGKVGGIGQYGRYFGPLSERLHAVIEEGQPLSAYHFPALGELRFVRDADTSDPLVMLASLVGKYVRELFMSRIARFYSDKESAEPGRRPSGYHDPVTEIFVGQTAAQRTQLRIVDDCFLRARATDRVAASRPATSPSPAKNQGSLF